ncbi:aromatic-ring hydroxylase C-terminal domain-containing protein [Nocardiopsis salina]
MGPGSRISPAALLHPDGHVARAGDGRGDGAGDLRAALSRWFGEASA